MGNQCTGDSGVLEAAAPDVAGQVLLGGREKLKETADFKLADEEEWARRQEELQKQAQEARRLRERKRAEADRKNEVELRQRQRLEEIRQNLQKEERNMGFKNQIRSKVQAELERVASGCRDMATLLRTLQIPVEGGLYPSNQQVSAAYKKALLRFHPDRTSASVKGDPQQQVQAEETFKLITRMKSLLQPSMFAMDTS
jgi:ATPase subunit of ABC transporter with duplicated ATPase domains